jgi:hypothetical protein
MKTALFFFAGLNRSGFVEIITGPTKPGIQDVYARARANGEHTRICAGRIPDHVRHDSRSVRQWLATMPGRESATMANPAVAG